MTNQPPNITSLYEDVQAALMILSRVSVPWPKDAPPPDIARAYWAFPLVGIGLAAIPALIGAGLIMAGIPPLAAGAAVLLGLMLISGGLHHDGIADLADGLGGHSIKERLAIMHDSRMGSFGTLALITITIINAACLAQLGQADPFFMAASVITIAAMSRGMMALQRWQHTTPQQSGLAHKTGKPSTYTMSVALMISLLTGLIFISTSLTILTMAAAIATTYLLGQFLRRWIGGVNGDGLGATQQLSEMAGLLILTLAV